jgi:calcineurin-like phosphoesterase family protein
MYWFISDTHLGHANIIKYCNRPFKSLLEMDETIIRNINERVDENDVLFMNGDFCMKKSSEASNAPQNAFDYYRNQIKCKNIIFIKGNHDKNNSTKTIIESIVIEHGGKRIFITHRPNFAKKDFHYNFCGHVHGKYGKFQKLDGRSYIVDLSVENWDYMPININEIEQAFSIWIKEGMKKTCKLEPKS